MKLLAFHAFLLGFCVGFLTLYLLFVTLGVPS